MGLPADHGRTQKVGLPGQCLDHPVDAAGVWFATASAPRDESRAGGLENVHSRQYGISGRRRFLYDADTYPPRDFDGLLSGIHPPGFAKGMVQSANVPSERRVGHAAEP